MSTKDGRKKSGDNSCGILVVGAGASGLMAALTAAGCGCPVTVLERNKKAGKKLLATGNGRCNLSNTDEMLWERYDSSTPDLLKRFTSALQVQAGVPDTLRHFREMGLLCRQIGGFVYPMNLQASSVLQILTDECIRQGVRFKFSQTVESVRQDQAGGSWQVKTGDGWTYHADSVILCCGSPASEKAGGYSGAFDPASRAGHTVNRPLPALTGLFCKGQGLAEAKGARTDAAVSLILKGASGHDEDEQCLFAETGQVQWTGDGVSGIVIFQLSSMVSRLMDEKTPDRLFVRTDLCPELTIKELECFFRERGGEAGKMLCGIINDRLVPAVEYNYRASMPGAAASFFDPALLAYSVKHLEFEITGTFGLDRSQTCAGGVSLREIDPDTLKSKLWDGLFFAGELMDCNGPCGGYNLQWAWSTGRLAGLSAAAYFSDK